MTSLIGGEAAVARVRRAARRNEIPPPGAEQAPSDPEVTNLQSFNEIISSTKGFEWVGDQQRADDYPPADSAQGVKGSVA